MPRPPPEATDPVWANTEKNIPKQNEAFAASSAARLHNTEQRVALPPGFDAHRLEGTWKKAGNRQTWLIQDAHAAANALTVLHDDSRLYRLEKAQEAELLAAAYDGPIESDALPPRAVAVTTLVHTKLRNRHMLLDAAAFLARVAPPEEPAARCARTVRMALLAGQAARNYGFNAAKSGWSTRYDPNATSQVCVSWIEERPDGEDGESARRVRSEFCEIAYAETALDYFNALRTAIVRTLMECEVAVEGSPASLHSVNGTRQLFTSMDADPEAVSGAYEAGVVETSEEFWKLLVHTTPARLSPALKDRKPDEFLCFEEEKIFLKLAPRGRELNHPEVFHGLLLYKKGMHRETFDYCVDAMREERKPQPNRHPNAPWGLRPPESNAAEELWLHVLSIHAELVALCEVVSGYGLEAVPGKRLVKDQPHCSVPRIVYRLEACDERFLSTTFVLPCTQEMCNPREKAVRLPLWETTEQAIVAYLPLFPPDYAGPWKEEEGEDEEGGARRTPPFSLTKHIAPPTEEDALLRSLLGMPFGVEAFRLGDLHAEVERLRYCPHLAAFLVAAIHELGPDTSIAQAFNDLTKFCQTHRSEVATLHKRIEQLKGEAEAANSNAESARKRLKVAVEEAVAEAKESAAQEAAAAAAEPSEQMTCTVQQAGVLLRGVGLRPVDDVALKQPLKGGRIVAIVRAYARAAGLAVSDEVANWSKKNATGEHFTALDTVTRTLANAFLQLEDGKRPILLVQVRGEVYFYELDWIDGEFCQEALSPFSALAPERANLAWLLWNDDESTIVPLVKIQ